MTNTEFSKRQLATILSALDDAPRSPANKGEALRAIGRSAQRFGLATDDVLAAAPGLLDGRLSPADFRAELQDPDEPSLTPVTDAPQGVPGAQDGGTTGQEEPQPPTAPAQAAVAPGAEGQAEPSESGAAAKPAKRKAKAKAEPSNAAPADKPAPRAGTKQAQMIGLLRRPEGATVEQIAAATGWQHHTIRGAISGSLKKKLGLTVEATRTREVGPNKTGAKGSSTVYRIIG